MRLIILMILLIPFAVFASDPEHVALVDTGYDACIQSGGTQCDENKNLLFRGGLPLPDNAPYDFNFENFRQNIFSYLNDFKKTFTTRASLPEKLDDLKNYRIVIIDLIYDFNQHGGAYELNELQNEFKDSGNVSTLQLPEQHKMYGLEKTFDANQYAFEWWPVTFAEIFEDDPEFIVKHINWPGKMGTPAHDFEPKEYKALNFPYLISGISFASDVENEDAKDLRTLLTTLPQDGHPYLIFYHCIAGKDRTGAVSASYFMKHGGYPYFSTVKNNQLQRRVGPVSLADALKFTTLPEREPYFGSVKFSKAFCLFLEKNPGDCVED